MLLAALLALGSSRPFRCCRTTQIWNMWYGNLLIGYLFIILKHLILEYGQLAYV